MNSPRPRRGSPNSSGFLAANRRTFIFFAKPCGCGTRRAGTAARPPLRDHPRLDRRTAGLFREGRRRSASMRLGRVSRAGYYRRLAPKASKRDDADLRDLIQRLALSNRHYGYRRIAHEFRRQGLIVDMKRVLRLAREDNLLALRRRPFVPQTTMSRHAFEIAPNLTRGLKPTGLDQIWVADITYVRLAEDFVYLAVVLDAFSRRLVGWALADHLEASLAIEALDMALGLRAPAPMSLIHHSDSQRRPIRLGRLSHAVECAQDRRQHEPAGQSLRQRQGGELHEDAQAREVNARTYAEIDDAVAASAPSSKPSTTPSACTPRSATNLQPSSKPNSTGKVRATQTRTEPCHPISRVPATGCSPNPTQKTAPAWELPKK